VKPIGKELIGEPIPKFGYCPQCRSGRTLPQRRWPRRRMLCGRRFLLGVGPAVSGLQALPDEGLRPPQRYIAAGGRYRSVRL
jgi:hypothetical protein